MSQLPRTDFSWTIACCPKPFRGRIDVIQRNALRSWVSLEPRPQVLVLGNEQGTAEVCEELDLMHVRDIERNHHGTPLVSDVFSKLALLGEGRILCYSNADILLLGDVDGSLRAVNLDRYLMVGQRRDLTSVQEFSPLPSWRAEVLAMAGDPKRLHGPTGIDYFFFPRSTFLKQLPPFALGRAAWDNFMIEYALAKRIPVIDATDAIIALHQNHDYGHVLGGAKTVWEGEEAQENRALANEPLIWSDIRDATWILKNGSLRRKPITSSWRRRLLRMAGRKRWLKSLARRLIRMRQQV